MAPTMATPVLVVDPDLIHKVDTRNVENLFSMWTVFSKCAGSVEQGRRLENLSWRLWNRETFCCEPSTPLASSTSAVAIAASKAGRPTPEIPELSGSVDSLADEEAIEFEQEEDTTSTSAPLGIARPRIVRLDSGASNRSRGRERHIGPDDLEKMVITIKQTSPATIKSQGSLEIPQMSPALEPLAEEEVAQLAPVVIASATPVVQQMSDSPDSAKSESVSESGSGASERSTTSIVRGFSPSVISNSYRSTPLPTIESESVPRATPVAASRNPANQKNAMFALGGSSQSGDSYVGSSLEDRVQTVQSTKKKAVFAFGASSGEDENSYKDPVASHKSSLSDGIRRSGTAKKQTSFMEAVEERRIGDDNPFESDDEDEIDESAIDDDDDSDEWEDSMDESGKSSIDEKTFFQRVDSRPGLVSRRSMLTTLLHEGDRAAALGNIASKSTPALYRSRKSSPNGRSIAASPDSDDSSPLMMKKGSKSPVSIPRSDARAIAVPITNNSNHQVAHSPKTTRRNMLATELTASLRRNLLWERQQKNSTASAVLKRRHTAHTDLQNIKEHPKRAHMDGNLKETQASWNQYFGQGLGEYHSKGW